MIVVTGNVLILTTECLAQHSRNQNYLTTKCTKNSKNVGGVLISHRVTELTEGLCDVVVGEVKDSSLQCSTGIPACVDGSLDSSSPEQLTDKNVCATLMHATANYLSLTRSVLHKAAGLTPQIFNKSISVRIAHSFILVAALAAL